MAKAVDCKSTITGSNPVGASSRFPCVFLGFPRENDRFQAFALARILPFGVASSRHVLTRFAAVLPRVVPPRVLIVSSVRSRRLLGWLFILFGFAGLQVGQGFQRPRQVMQSGMGISTDCEDGRRLPGQLLACLDRCPADHDAADVRVPRRVEVDNVPCRVFVLQEVGLLSLLSLGVCLGRVDPLLPGCLQIRPARALSGVRRSFHSHRVNALIDVR